MASGIYSITNTLNGHIYVGSAVNFARRWNGHKKELNRGTGRVLTQEHRDNLSRAAQLRGNNENTYRGHNK